MQGRQDVYVRLESARRVVYIEADRRKGSLTISPSPRGGNSYSASLCVDEGSPRLISIRKVESWARVTPLHRSLLVTLDARQMKLVAFP